MQEVLDTTWPAGGNVASALTFTNDKNFLKILEQWNSETPNLYAFPHFPYQGNSWNNAHHTRVYSVYMKAKADVDFFLHHTNFQDFNNSGIQYHCAVVCDLWNNTYTSVAFHNSRTHTGSGSNGSNWYHSANEAIPLKSGKLYKLYIISYFVNYSYYSGSGYQFAWQTSPQATPSDSLSTGYNYGSIQSTNVNGISVWYATMRENDKIEWYSYHPIIQQNGPDTAGGIAQLNLVSNHLSSNLTAGREIGQINFKGRWHSTSTASILEFGGIRCNATGTGSSTTSRLTFHNSNGLERMRIDEGNVGIGTTSPGAYLHVRSTDNVANYAVPQVLITTDPASNYNQWASLELRGSYIGNTVPYGVGIRTTYGHDSGYRTYGDFNIYTSDRDNGNARTDRLTVTSEGNVGIGTTGPSYKLHVNGDIKGTNIYKSGSIIHGNLRIDSNQFYVTGGGDCYFNWSGNGNTYCGNTGKLLRLNGSKILLQANHDQAVGVCMDGSTDENPDRGLCILDNQNTGQAIGSYYIGYSASYQESAALKIFQHLPIMSGSYRTSDGGGNADPAINIITNFIGSGANSTTHQGGTIQWTNQSRDTPTGGSAHGQAYAAIYGGRHSDYNNFEGEMIFYTSDTTNRASGRNLNPRMTIKGGNVGIGTTSPGSKLEVYDDSAAGQVKDILHVKNYAGYDMVSLGTSSNYNSGAISVYINSSTKFTPSVLINGNGDSYFNGGDLIIGGNSQYQDAKLSINVGDEGTMLSSPDISQFLWRINNSTKWGIYWSTNSSGNNYYLNSDSNPNQIVFVGNNTARAAIDLDNGSIRTNDWFYVDGSDDGIYWEQHGGGWNMTDSTWMRLYNGKRLYMSDGGIRIDNCGSGDENSGIHLIGNYPTMWLRTTDSGGSSYMLHVDGQYFYILSGSGNTTSWSNVNGAWPLMIRRSDNAVKMGYHLSAGDSWPAYRIWAFGGHIGQENGYEVLSRYTSSKNGDWLYLDSNSNAPSGYHAQTVDGSNMYFNVQGYYVAYLNNGNVGRIDFTGQHRAMPEDENLLKCVRNYVGLIVVSTGNINSLIRNDDTNVHEQLRGMKGIDINEAIPQVILSTSYKQKTVYGVIADGEDDEYYNSHERTTGKNMPDGQRPFQKNFPSQLGSDRTIKEFSWGAWGTVVQCEQEDDRLFINSVGEGGIWVCDEMGLIENGDYITSSNIPGYGCVQDDDLLHNYTVAKACMDCDFTLSYAGEQEKKQSKRGTWCKDKRRRADDSDTESDCECDDIDEDHHFGEHYEPECCDMPHKKDKHGMVYYPDAICHDASGCCEFETCCDCSGNPIMEDYYFEDADYKCKEITHNGKTYRIAFIACTYHCG